MLTCVWLFVTPWTVAHQAPLSIEFSSQEYWSGLPISFPGDLLDLGIWPASPALQADSLPPSHQGNPLQTEYTMLGNLNMPKQRAVFLRRNRTKFTLVNYKWEFWQTDIFRLTECIMRQNKWIKHIISNNIKWTNMVYLCSISPIHQSLSLFKF